jgi:SDR family mycofactocin-dependent oxidoreductase
VGRLDGRVALVTGGGRGQGRAHAVTLAREGADIAICDIGADVATIPYPLARPADLADTARMVEAEGRRCVAVQADVRDTEQIGAAVAATVSAFGRIDIAVANAGVCSFAPFGELADDAWADMLDINLTGVFKTLRAVLPVMVAQGGGRMVATSSMGGRQGMANLAHYSAAKFGVIGLVKSLALEVATQGITVNAVCPSTVDTEMVHNPALYGLFCPGFDEPGREDVQPIYERMNPMRVPWLDPEEVARATAFLVSDDARHISGTVLEVSCGGSAYQH